ncbi:MAG: DUF6435 family protein [Myxococcota bacterium]
MFGWFKSDPIKKLQREYEAKMKEAKDAEKFGDRARQAELYTEAEAIFARLEAAKAEASGSAS